jgi:hypothetical protein
MPFFGPGPWARPSVSLPARSSTAKSKGGSAWSTSRRRHRDGPSTICSGRRNRQGLPRRYGKPVTWPSVHSRKHEATTLPNPPLQRTWSSLTLGTTPLNARSLGLGRVMRLVNRCTPTMWWAHAPRTNANGGYGRRGARSAARAGGCWVDAPRQNASGDRMRRRTGAVRRGAWWAHAPQQCPPTRIPLGVRIIRLQNGKPLRRAPPPGGWLHLGRWALGRMELRSPCGSSGVELQLFRFNERHHRTTSALSTDEP